MKIIVRPQLIGGDDAGAGFVGDISKVLLGAEIGIRGNIELGHQVPEVRIHEGQNTTGSRDGLQEQFSDILDGVLIEQGSKNTKKGFDGSGRHVALGRQGANLCANTEKAAALLEQFLLAGGALHKGRGSLLKILIKGRRKNPKFARIERVLLFVHNICIRDLRKLFCERDRGLTRIILDIC